MYGGGGGGGVHSKSASTTLSPNSRSMRRRRTTAVVAAAAPAAAVPRAFITPFSDAVSAVATMVNLSKDKMAVVKETGFVPANRGAEEPSDALAPVRLAGEPVDITFNNISCSVMADGKEKEIMKGVSGVFKAGSLSAVMGPSGAGKTTLFSVLLGKLKIKSGSVSINNKNADLRELEREVGFVPQSDIMLGELTVKEILTHAAESRLPASWSTAQKAERVQQVLESLSLVHVQDSVVGDPEHGKRGISGGERKRVSIGIELLSNPKVLLLDEPTTGLDSTTSLDVVRLLRRIASQRVNVICVLHQPRNLIFDLFDDMLLLAPGGLTVYNGKASKAVRYFRQKNFPCPPTTNPSDWFIDVLSGKVPLPPNSNINSDEKNNNDVKSIKIDAPAGKPNNNDDDESVPSSQLAPIVQKYLVAEWKQFEQDQHHQQPHSDAGSLPPSTNLSSPSSSSVAGGVCGCLSCGNVGACACQQDSNAGAGNFFFFFLFFFSSFSFFPQAGSNNCIYLPIALCCNNTAILIASY